MDLIKALGQGGGGGGGGGSVFGTAPRALPPAPIWERWLLETPLWPGVILILAGLAAFYILNQSGKARQGLMAAAACLAAAAGVYILGSAVTTTRETLRDQTADLVAAVALADATRVGELLAPDIAVRPVGPIPAMGRNAVLAFIETQMKGQYRLENYRVLELQASVDGVNLARTQSHVRVTPAAWKAPAFTWWRLDWRKDADGLWRVTAIEVLNLR